MQLRQFATRPGRPAGLVGWSTAHNVYVRASLQQLQARCHPCVRRVRAVTKPQQSEAEAFVESLALDRAAAAEPEESLIVGSIEELRGRLAELEAEVRAARAVWRDSVRGHRGGAEGWDRMTATWGPPWGAAHDVRSRPCGVAHS